MASTSLPCTHPQHAMLIVSAIARGAPGRSTVFPTEDKDVVVVNRLFRQSVKLRDATVPLFSAFVSRVSDLPESYWKCVDVEGKMIMDTFSLEFCLDGVIVDRWTPPGMSDSDGLAGLRQTFVHPSTGRKLTEEEMTAIAGHKAALREKIYADVMALVPAEPGEGEGSAVPRITAVE